MRTQGRTRFVVQVALLGIACAVLSALFGIERSGSTGATLFVIFVGGWFVLALAYWWLASLLLARGNLMGKMSEPATLGGAVRRASPIMWRTLEWASVAWGAVAFLVAIRSMPPDHPVGTPFYLMVGWAGALYAADAIAELGFQGFLGRRRSRRSQGETPAGSQG
jgi:hypothetical protein